MGLGTYILDENHQPVLCEDSMKWARWFETAERKVALTEIGDSRISTVFMGLDHSFGDGPPVLWETMVFDGPLDGEQDRYTSYEDAQRGHEAMCRRVREEGS